MNVLKLVVISLAYLILLVFLWLFVLEIWVVEDLTELAWVVTLMAIASTTIITGTRQ